MAWSASVRSTCGPEWLIVNVSEAGSSYPGAKTTELQLTGDTGIGFGWFGGQSFVFVRYLEGSRAQLEDSKLAIGRVSEVTYYYTLPEGITWNPKESPIQTTVLFQGLLFGCHVDLGERKSRSKRRLSRLGYSTSFGPNFGPKCRRLWLNCHMSYGPNSLCKP